MNDFEKVAANLHRRHVHQSALDAAIADAPFVNPQSKVWPKDSEDVMCGGVEEPSEYGNAGVDAEGDSPAARGHKGGLLGGPKRDEVLTPEEKTKIARKGGYARWGEAKSERES